MKNGSEASEITRLKLKIASMEQLIDTHKKSISENTEKLRKEIAARKKAEEELQKSERRFKDLTEHISDWVWEVDAAGTYTYSNTKVKDILGYDPEEIIGKTPFDFMSREEAKRMEVEFQSVMQEQRSFAGLENVNYHKNGQPVILETSGVPVLDSLGQLHGYRGIDRDITTRKKAEEEIQFKARLLDSTNDSIMVHTVEGDIIYVNEAACRLLGYTEQELTSMNVTDIVTMRAVALQKAEFLQLMEAKKEHIFQAVHIKKDKTEIQVEVHSRLVNYGEQEYILNVNLDITERKHAERKLKEAFDSLTSINNKLEGHNVQNTIMSEMNELLQACSTIQEIPSIVTSSIIKLFPKSHGALFLMNDSRTEMQSVTRWGEFPGDVDEDNFSSDSCWALRRAKAYIVENPEIEPICTHIKHTPIHAYACLPLAAKGEIIGLLHLREETDDPASHETISDIRDVSSLLTEYLSLSIANIQLREKLISQSIRDPLTGLYNRRYMENMLRQELSRSERKHTKLSIIMIDVDYFKQFNDTYGHDAGDTILTKLAEFIKMKVRQLDVACRFGGEEFLLILPECTSDDAFKRVDEIREEVRNLTVFFNNQQLTMPTISMGIATYPDHGTDATSLLRFSDKALYTAKQEGRDRVIIFSEKMA